MNAIFEFYAKFYPGNFTFHFEAKNVFAPCNIGRVRLSHTYRYASKFSYNCSFSILYVAIFIRTTDKCVKKEGVNLNQ